MQMLHLRRLTSTWLWLVIIVASVGLTHSASAATGLKRFAFQGVVTSLPDGVYDMDVQITGGKTPFTTSVTGVQVTNGVFSILIDASRVDINNASELSQDSFYSASGAPNVVANVTVKNGAGGVIDQFSGLPMTSVPSAYVAHTALGLAPEVIIPSTQISGLVNSAANATNFTGALSGDVSGNQSTTSVDKIKGLGVPTSGGATDGGKYLRLNGAGTAFIYDTVSGGGSYSNGTGLTLTGSVFAVDSGTSANKIVQLDGNGKIPSSILTNTELVTTSGGKILSSNIDATSIPNNTINSSHITDGSIGAADLALSGVSTQHLAPNSITSVQLATNSITDSKIADVGAGKINTGTLANARLPSAIDVANVAAGSFDVKSGTSVAGSISFKEPTTYSGGQTLTLKLADADLATNLVWNLPATAPSANNQLLKFDNTTNTFYWDNDAGAGGGVTGPGAVTAVDQLVRWTGTTGSSVKGSPVSISDAGDVSGIGTLNATTAHFTGLAANGVVVLDGSSNLQSAVRGNLAGMDTISISGGNGSVIGSGTNISISTASGSSNGILTQTDWQNFNGKADQANVVAKIGDTMTGGLGLPSIMFTGLPAIDMGAARFMRTESTGELAFGKNAGNAAGIGAYSTFIGAQAGYQNDSSSGWYNTSVGYLSGYGATTAQHNANFGMSAGYLATGSRNTFVGSSAGKNSSTGSDNVAVGSFAGSSLAGAQAATLVGGSSNVLSNAAFGTAIGHSAVVAANSAIQLGAGQNNAPDSLQFYGWNFLTKDGAAKFSQLALTPPGTVGEIKLADNDGTTNYVALKAPATLGANVAWTLPALDGVSGQVLGTNGAGLLMWQAGGGGGGGAGLAKTGDTMTGALGLDYAGVVTNRIAYVNSNRQLVTSSLVSPSELDFLSGVTASLTKMNSFSAAEAGFLAGVTSSIGSKLNLVSAPEVANLIGTTASVQGQLNAKLNLAGGALTGQLVLVDGSAATPSLSFVSDASQNTGIYRSAEDELALTTGGTRQFYVNTMGVWADSPLWLKNQQEIRLLENTGNGTEAIALKAPASVPANITFTLPSTTGSNGQVLQTDGTGVLSWAAPPSIGMMGGVAKAGDTMTGSLDLGTTNLKMRNAIVWRNIGLNNTLVGVSAGIGLTSGDSNVMLGDFAGSGIAGASNRNVFIGYQTGFGASGVNNTLLGWQAGLSLGNGSYNVVIGDGAGTSLTTGGNSVIIGSSAGASSNGNDTVIIGGNATGTGNQSVAVGSSAIINGGSAVAIGIAARGNGNYSVGLGAAAQANASSAVQIGRGTNATVESLQFLGWNFLKKNGDATFNNVESKSVLAGVTTGTDSTGAVLVVQSGQGTGAAAPSAIEFKTPNSGSSGTTTQSVSTKMIIKGGNVGIGTTTPSSTHDLTVQNAALAAQWVAATDGSPSTPGFQWSSDSDTGLFKPATNEVGITSDGTEIAKFTPTGMILGGGSGVLKKIVKTNMSFSSFGFGGSVTAGSCQVSTGQVSMGGVSNNGNWFLQAALDTDQSYSGLTVTPIITSSGSNYIKIVVCNYSGTSFTPSGSVYIIATQVN